MDVNFIAPKRNIKSSGSGWETNTLQSSNLYLVYRQWQYI